MKKILPLTILLLLTNFGLKAQNSFRFSCNKDTVLPCDTKCFTLKAKIPNVHANTDDYVINPLSGSLMPTGCFNMYIDPATPGNDFTQLIDDTYTDKINIGFDFSFYGKKYPKLVVSTNGYISFDTLNALFFSHWNISQDLPSNFYDKALIMGPYHDIIPGSNVNTSPTQRIKFEVIGTAPHRKWIISYYKIPLFLNACTPLIENTHQIVLYESLGVIEVFIADKQICPQWNNGKAIVGIQNYEQNKGLMAPGRKASSPPWGSIGMNESWRFVPIAGPSLFKKVELFDLANNLIATGNVQDIGSGTFDVTFPNVCPTSPKVKYVIKSTYKKMDDPNVEVYGADTIQVLIGDQTLSVNANATPATCNGDDGKIELAGMGGTPPYQYSIDSGMQFQANKIFVASIGDYPNIILKDNKGCLTKTNATISLNDTMYLELGTDTNLCKGKSMKLTPKTNEQTTVFNWSPAEGLSSATLKNPIAAPSDTTTYTLVARWGVCERVDKITLNMLPYPITNAGNDTNAIVGTPHQLLGSGIGSYVWSPANVLDNPFSPTPFATLFNDTKFTLKITNTAGCERSDEVLIKVYKGPAYYVPNAFSPNGDGLNDVFRPIPVGIARTDYFRVFNRYGELLFQTTQFLKGWDGTLKGVKQMPGTYVWLLKGVDKDGNVIERKGSVILIQ